MDLISTANILDSLQVLKSINRQFTFRALMGSLLDQFTQDFTVHVVRMEPYPFANGGCADIWIGKREGMLHGDENLLAVKVPRGAPVGADLVQLKKRVIQEGFIWSTATHPNITPFLGVTFNFDRPGLPCLVSPYYRHGNITAYLKDRPYTNKVPLITQFADALLYLHDVSIVHGNLQANNILITDDGKVSLADFGVACLRQTSGSSINKAIGTWHFVAPELTASDEIIDLNDVMPEAWRWMAPELIQTSMNAVVGYTKQVTQATDIWAFAMTVIEILTGRVPFFSTRNDAKVILAIIAGGLPKWEDYPSIRADVWRLLESCWTIDPNQRPSMADVFHFFTLRSNQLPRL